MRKIFLSIAFLSAILIGCQKQKALEPVPVNEECKDTVSYNQFIAPEIINKSCNLSGCHADGAGGKTWNNHAEVSGNAALIYSAISHESGVTPMPFGGDKLSDTLIAKFKCWIDQGKLDN